MKEHTLEELKKVIKQDLDEEIYKKFPTYHGKFPESFLEDVIEDVYATSAWQDDGSYIDGDISVAIQRTILRALGEYV